VVEVRNAHGYVDPKFIEWLIADRPALAAVTAMMETTSDTDIPPSPVQQHVDAIVDDISAGRLNPIQTGNVKRALENAAVTRQIHRKPVPW
jgi:hypothetical protein